MYGFSILAELCAQQVLSVSIEANLFSSHFDILSIQSNATEMVLNSVRRCSDSLCGNTEFLADLEAMSTARGFFQKFPKIQKFPNIKTFSKNSKCFQKFKIFSKVQKFSKNSKMQKFFKNSKKFQRIFKNSKMQKNFKKISKNFQNFSKIQKKFKNSKKFQKFKNSKFFKKFKILNILDQIVIYQCHQDDIKSKIKKIENLFDANDWEMASEKIAELKSFVAKTATSNLRFHNFNNIFLDGKLKHLEGRLSVKETGLNSKVPYALMDSLGVLNYYFFFETFFGKLFV